MSLLSISLPPPLLLPTSPMHLPSSICLLPCPPPPPSIGVSYHWFLFYQFQSWPQWQEVGMVGRGSTAICRWATSPPSTLLSLPKPHCIWRSVKNMLPEFLLTIYDIFEYWWTSCLYQWLHVGASRITIESQVAKGPWAFTHNSGFWPTMKWALT